MREAREWRRVCVAKAELQTRTRTESALTHTHTHKYTHTQCVLVCSCYAGLVFLVQCIFSAGRHFVCITVIYVWKVRLLYNTCCHMHTSVRL